MAYVASDANSYAMAYTEDRPVLYPLDLEVIELVSEHGTNDTYEFLGYYYDRGSLSELRAALQYREVPEEFFHWMFWTPDADKELFREIVVHFTGTVSNRYNIISSFLQSPNGDDRQLAGYMDLVCPGLLNDFEFDYW